MAKVDALLAWYDSNAREMPWRIGPHERMDGALPDPYHVWLSEIMLQQTTVAAVGPYFRRFITLWPTLSDLASAQADDVLGEWAGLGYYARARNLIKCAKAVEVDHGGQFPKSYDELLKLPGIGPYTAAAVSAIAFDAPSTVVDGNVERVIARLKAIETPLPSAKLEIASFAQSLTPTKRPGDYAQAIMDLGATVCTPRSPSCGICPWATECEARQQGRQQEFPKKVPKKTKPVRFGKVWIARRTDGAWLLERRPENGLLGGMLGWPGTDWSEDPKGTPPCQLNWENLESSVRHTFTHFHLHLEVAIGRAALSTVVNRGAFKDPSGFRATDLPTVMRKAFDLASAHLIED